MNRDRQVNDKNGEKSSTAMFRKRPKSIASFTGIYNIRSVIRPMERVNVGNKT